MNLPKDNGIFAVRVGDSARHWSLAVVRTPGR
jgi:hypothetical protein